MKERFYRSLEVITIREILFKAKRKDNGKWSEGKLFDDGLIGSTRMFVGGIVIEEYKGTADDEWDITGIDFCEVNPSTICQYTGLNDSNAKKIWENDIVEVIWHSGKIERYLIWWSREMSMMEAISLKDINFNGNDYWGGQPQIEYSTFCLMMQDPWGDIKEVKVLGNIFDNPELLEN